jgi:hypothetical protein
MYNLNYAPTPLRVQSRREIKSGGTRTKKVEYHWFGTPWPKPFCMLDLNTKGLVCWFQKYVDFIFISVLWNKAAAHWKCLSGFPNFLYLKLSQRWIHLKNEVVIMCWAVVYNLEEYEELVKWWLVGNVSNVLLASSVANNSTWMA